MSDAKKASLSAARLAAEARANGASVTTAGSSNTIAGIPLIPIVAVIAVLGAVAIAFLTRK
jgi:hypothetical protein